jgi:hypothetical protein
LDTENDYSISLRKKSRSIDEQVEREEKLSYQQQTVLSLYICRITPEIIAIQLDLTKKEVIKL